MAMPSVDPRSESVGAASLEKRTHAARSSRANIPTRRSPGASGWVTRRPCATPCSLRKAGHSAGAWPRRIRPRCTRSTNNSTRSRVGSSQPNGGDPSLPVVVMLRPHPAPLGSQAACRSRSAVLPGPPNAGPGLPVGPQARVGILLELDPEPRLLSDPAELEPPRGDPRHREVPAGPGTYLRMRRAQSALDAATESPSRLEPVLTRRPRGPRRSGPAGLTCPTKGFSLPKAEFGRVRVA